MKRWNAGLCNTTPRFKLLHHKLAKFQKEGLPILYLTLRQAVSDIIIFFANSFISGHSQSDFGRKENGGGGVGEGLFFILTCKVDLL